MSSRGKVSFVRVITRVRPLSRDEESNGDSYAVDVKGTTVSVSLGVPGLDLLQVPLVVVVHVLLMLHRSPLRVAA
jgi:hypothetical protein